MPRQNQSEWKKREPRPAYDRNAERMAWREETETEEEEIVFLFRKEESDEE